MNGLCDLHLLIFFRLCRAFFECNIPSKSSLKSFLDLFLMLSIQFFYPLMFLLTLILVGIFVDDIAIKKAEVVLDHT